MIQSGKLVSPAGFCGAARMRALRDCDDGERDA
jgi:hypothetical protein